MGILPPLIDYMTKKSSMYLLFLLFIHGSLSHYSKKCGQKMQITHGTIFMTDLSGCLNKHSHCVFLSTETR